MEAIAWLFGGLALLAIGYTAGWYDHQHGYKPFYPWLKREGD